MKAGRMDTRLRVWRLTHGEANAFSEAEAEYVCEGEWWAERCKWQGRRREEASEHFAAYDASWNVRDSHRPAEGWRLREGEDGPLFEIAAIDRYRSIGMLTLHCFKVNE